MKINIEKSPFYVYDIVENKIYTKEGDYQKN